MQNALKSNEWRRIWVNKTFKTELQKDGPNNWVILRNWFAPEIKSSLFNLKKFKDSEKTTLESCKTHWNLMNDKKFGTLKPLKLKYRRGDQIIQTFCKIGSNQNLVPPSLICRNFKTVRKLLLNHAECIEIWWMTINLGLENF